MGKLLSIVLMALSINALGVIHQVGSTKNYVSPNALYLANVIQDGDTIEVDAETYIGSAALAVWQNNELLIKGVGGMPHLISNGSYIWGKGIWVLVGNDITVEHIEFSEAAVPDQNGAGIRLDGIGLTVRHCYFHDNENGILTSNPYDGDILIEFSEFSNNGYGDGFSHNLYIGHVNKLTFRFNYSHHAKIGHNLKSRANENYILYNRIMDEETGNSSRLIDLPNGGFAILLGNLLMQGQNAENNNLVGYGKEGLSNTAPHELYMANNTLLNKRTTSCIFLDINNETSNMEIFNNIFAGTGTTINGVSANLMNGNVIEANVSMLEFVDEPNFDYRLRTNSPAIDYGVMTNPVNGLSLIPDLIYEHPTNFMHRNTVNNIDAGAYEFNGVVSIEDTTPNIFAIYPNPTKGILKFNMERNFIKQIVVYNILGEMMTSTFYSNELDISFFAKGVYFVVIEGRQGENYHWQLVKE
ncbi:MAG: T9SS type A sorting domain-containing protein [Chitinophagales bacterium]